jgi:hypothetical protein
MLHLKRVRTTGLEADVSATSLQAKTSTTGLNAKVTFTRIVIYAQEYVDPTYLAEDYVATIIP